MKATRICLVYLDMARTDDLAALADSSRKFGEVSGVKESGEAIFFDERTKELKAISYRVTFGVAPRSEESARRAFSEQASEGAKPQLSDIVPDQHNKTPINTILKPLKGASYYRKRVVQIVDKF